MHPFRMLATALPVFLLASSALGETEVKLIQVGKKERTCTLETIGKDGSLRVQAGGKTENVPAGSVVEVLFKRGEFPASPEQARLLLHNGDRLVGTVRGGTEGGGGFLFEDSALGSLVFEDFGSVRWVLFPGTEEPPALPGGDEDADVVFRGEEGSVSGSLKAFGQHALSLERPDLDLTIEVPYRGARAVYIAPLWEPESSTDLCAVLTLTNGDILTGTVRGGGEGSVVVTLPGGLKARVPLSRLVSLGVRNGDFVYLSDLEPVRITENPWAFDPPVTHEAPFEGKAVYNFRRDRSYTGGPLRINGRTYLKGVGSHSWTEIEYDLDGAYERFEARVGIDDSAGPGKGSVIFRVRLDGEEVFTSPVMVGGKDPVPVRVDVSAGKKLVLVVDYTHELLTVKDGREEDHVLDRADWALARLVKKSE